MNRRLNRISRTVLGFTLERTMRYLTTFLAILACALLIAAARSQCPADTIEAWSDGKLPFCCRVSPVDARECSQYFWSLNFQRTDKNAGRTIIAIAISGLDVNISIDSDICLPGWYYLSGKGVIEQNAIHIWPAMELDPANNTTGHFKDIKLIYYTF